MPVCSNDLGTQGAAEVWEESMNRHPDEAGRTCLHCASAYAIGAIHSCPRETMTDKLTQSYADSTPAVDLLQKIAVMGERIRELEAGVAVMKRNCALEREKNAEHESFSREELLARTSTLEQTVGDLTSQLVSWTARAQAAEADVDRLRLRLAYLEGGKP